MSKAIDFRAVVPEKFPLVPVQFPDSQYIKEITDKTQICWHHTASGPGTRGDINTWLADKQRVGTPVIIAHDGTINQLFSSKYWINHLGIEVKHFQQYLKGTKFKVTPGIQNKLLNMRCIGMEIDNWGPLRFDEKTGKFYAWPNDYGRGPNVKSNSVVDPKKVVEFAEKFKNQKYFEMYTDEQLECAMYMSAYWCLFYGIDPNVPADKNQFKKRMFEVCPEALAGVSGMYTHVSYRPDKSDLSPQDKVYDFMRGVVDIVNKHA